jgi:hypothetical protein
VRAEVAQGVELAVDVEDADAGPAAEGDDEAPPAGRDLVRPADDDSLGH